MNRNRNDLFTNHTHKNNGAIQVKQSGTSTCMIGGGPNSYMSCLHWAPHRVRHRIWADSLTLQHQGNYSIMCGGANFKEDGHSWDSIWCTCEKVGLTIIGGDRAHQQLNCILRIDDDLSKQLTNQIRLAMQAGHNSLLHKARADKSLRKKSFEFGVKFCGFANNL